MEYEAVIGLETHVQLRTKSKMWCGCANQFGAPPNTNVCPVCLGLPGVLPVANDEALRLTALTGLLLNCTVSSFAKFDRKNYFYPDMPKNYQITQYDKPSTVNGYVDFEFHGGISRVRITRAHLEEDVGKNFHFEQNSGVDFNRAGVPLLEIVSEPDITSADMAYDYLNALKSAREKVNSIEVDRTRVKPLVKITGEFWAQLTEGDGNFHMFEFLEREGAQVVVEPIATWVAYLMYQAKAHAIAKWPVNQPYRNAEWYELKKQFANYIGLRKKLWGIGFGQMTWNYFYHRVIKHLGGITHQLVPQEELAEMAHPFYNQFARGGEGHLEVGKNVYYTVHKLCHMVLALKPFGCMPSSQSDGVQSAVINKFKDMIFLPIETSGEGEVNAHSRVQMALGEAKVKAKGEFEQCLKSTGKTMVQIREYIAEHPELKRPFYHVPHREGVAGTAAQFILHVSDRIDKDTRFWKKARVPGVAIPQAAGGD